MTGGTLAEQLAPLGIVLDAATLDRLEWLGRELLRWNRTHNLTLLPFLDSPRRLLDLGSGGGFPGLPLKIARPALEVVSVDAVGKKIAFQRHVARTLHLAGFTAIHGRAETLPGCADCTAGFDVVTARALGSLPLLASLAAPCLAPGGRLIAMKGAEGAAELALAEAELATLGFDRGGLHQFRLPRSGAERCLVVLVQRRSCRPRSGGM